MVKMVLVDGWYLSETGSDLALVTSVKKNQVTYDYLDCSLEGDYSGTDKLKIEEFMVLYPILLKDRNGFKIDN